MDRINGLPNEIICHIVSFVYAKEAAYLTILSKRFQNVFTIIPYLEFTYEAEKQGRSLMDFLDGVLVFCLCTTLPLVGKYCLYGLWELTSLAVRSRYAPICGVLFSVFDFTLKLLRISKTIFTVTKKTFPKQRQDMEKDHLKEKIIVPITGKSDMDGSLFSLPDTFIL